jgi:Type II secretion system (T2SS), protein E, N-terminal domain
LPSGQNSAWWDDVRSVGTILELLQKVQLIDGRGADAVMSRAKSRSGGHIVQQVAELGLATESNIARSLSVELAIPRIDLHMTPPEPGALNLLDARICVDRFILPVALRESGGLLWLAMADPTDQESIGLVARRTQKRVRPAVAAPSEILRTARQCYGAPMAGVQQQQPEHPPAEKLAAIELDDTSTEEMQVVDLMDESASPLSRIAAQLGKPVPRRPPHSDALEIADDDPHLPAAVSHATPPRAMPRIPPPTPAPPTKKDTPVQGTAKVSKRSEPDVFAVTSGGPIEHDDLTSDDMSTLEALRQSLEKGAIVLRAIAELCVEKGVLTLKDMRRKRS